MQKKIYNLEEQINRIKSHIDGDLTPIEEEAFQKWLKSSKANEELLNRIEDKQLLLEKIYFSERNDKEKGWQCIQKKIHSRQLFAVRLLRYVAGILIPLVAGYMIYYYGVHAEKKQAKQIVHQKLLPVKGESKAYLELVSGEHLMLDRLYKMDRRFEDGSISTKGEGTVIVDGIQKDSIVEKEVRYNRLVIPKGGEYKIVLADGTQVWINSLSTLEFPICFVGEERRIRFTGEAYFDVVQNAEKPFIIECGDKEIVVRGTTFNVNDYNGRFVTTLETGKVEVKIGAEYYDLNPSMQICTENGEILLQKVNTKEFTAWKDGLFVFKKQKLKDVLETLSRWYNMEVFFQKEELKNLHFTGTIKRHSDIADVLNFLSKTDMVNFTIDGQTLVVSH